MHLILGKPLLPQQVCYLWGIVVTSGFYRAWHKSNPTYLWGKRKDAQEWSWVLWRRGWRWIYAFFHPFLKGFFCKLQSEQVFRFNWLCSLIYRCWTLGRNLSSILVKFQDSSRTKHESVEFIEKAGYAMDDGALVTAEEGGDCLVTWW